MGSHCCRADSDLARSVGSLGTHDDTIEIGGSFSCCSSDASSPTTIAKVSTTRLGTEHNTMQPDAQWCNR